MAYKKVGGFEELETLRVDESEGQVSEFKILSVKEKVGQYNSTVYTVETKDGKKMQLWGNAVLDARLPACALGNMIKTVYLGKTPSKEKGRQPFKNFDVFEDDGSDGPDESPATEGAKKTVPF